MTSSVKKASSVIRNSFRSKRYIIFDAEENNYILTTPQKKLEKRDDSDGLRKSFRNRNNKGNVVSASACSNQENENVAALANTSDSVPKQSQPRLKRTNSVTQSMRVAVGVLRQKLKISSNRGQSQITPKRAGKRQTNRDVQLYSPFKIDTPKGESARLIQNCHSMETPTRLKREVESLTAGMRALSAMTPTTLQSRSRTRKSLLLTNNRLKSPRSTSKRSAL